MLGAALLLSLALAMDATAVAATQGLAADGNSRRGLRLALLFGGFQGGMSALGWLGGHVLGDRVAKWDYLIAFALLVLLGLKMLWDARGAERDPDAPTPEPTWRIDIMLAIATSIDALAAGVTLPLIAEPALALVCIAVVTALLSGLAFAFARRLHARSGPQLTALGGLVLIGMGCNILLRHTTTMVSAPVMARPDATPTAVVPRPLTEETLAAFASLTLADATVVVRLRNADVVDLQVTPTGTSQLTAELEISRCLTCMPITLADWQPHAAAIRATTLPPALRDDASIIMKLEARVIASVPMMLVRHQAARLLGNIPVASHVITAFTNDSLRQLRVTVRDHVAPRRAGETAIAAFVDDVALTALLDAVVAQAALAWTR